jgi:hypothetical protein
MIVKILSNQNSRLPPVLEKEEKFTNLKVYTANFNICD